MAFPRLSYGANGSYYELGFVQLPFDLGAGQVHNVAGAKFETYHSWFADAQEGCGLSLRHIALKPESLNPLA
jgi:hypothetical protein